jgi:Tripartite tricarboxylate transporter TctB family
MQFRGRKLTIDWGHLIVLLLIAGATAWYLLDARAVSLKTNNLLLIQPLSIAALILCAVIVPQCIHFADEVEAEKEARTGEDIDPAELMQPKLPTERREVIKMLSMGALLGLFVFSLPILGFDVAILLFCIVGMMICGERRPLPLVVFPAAVTVVMVYGFKALMPYPMPTAIL